jgi:phospholipase D1/2
MAKTTQHRRARRWVVAAVLGLALLMVALIAAWQGTALQEVAEPRAVARWLRALGHTAWLPAFVAAAYVGASLVVFPNTVLCLGVIMALGPLEGTLYAFAGSVAAALVGYALGRRGGRHVEKLRFAGFERMSEQLRRGGFVQVLALRLLPIAPFTATNILSGAARVRMLPYVAATLLGIAPYILTFALFGRQARRLLSDPTPLDVAVTVAIAVVATLALLRARALAAARPR